jgi:hypothetical protein
MLETWTPLEIVAAFVAVVTIGGPVVFAWADRWLDRTRNKTTDVVETKE